MTYGSNKLTLSQGRFQDFFLLFLQWGGEGEVHRKSEYLIRNRGKNFIVFSGSRAALCTNASNIKSNVVLHKSLSIIL